MSTELQHPAWTADLRPPRWLWLLLLVLPLAAVIALIGYQSTQVLPRLSIAPSYSLTDQDGKRLTNEDLRGALVVYNFTHTRCAAPCVDSSLSLRRLQDTLAGVDSSEVPVHFVTITFDPAHDTPDVMYGYANKLGADTDLWHFASGDPQQIRNLMLAGFEIDTLPTTGDSAHGDSAHGEPFMALVDGWGIVRALYRTATPTLEVLKRDLRLVAQEARNSSGVNRYAYEAVHLFMCHNNLAGQP